MIYFRSPCIQCFQANCQGEQKTLPGTVIVVFKFLYINVAIFQLNLIKKFWNINQIPFRSQYYRVSVILFESI